jgi:hypothetical protein
MYSEIFAADMYATIFKKAPLDPALGNVYRDKILRPGGSRDEQELLRVSSNACAAGMKLTHANTTGLPWSPAQLGRLHKRALRGYARTGSLVFKGRFAFIEAFIVYFSLLDRVVLMKVRRGHFFLP